MTRLLSVDQNTWRVRSSPELERAGSDITLNSTLQPHTQKFSHNFTRKFSSLYLLPTENSFCRFQDFFKIESLLLLIINHPEYPLLLFVDFLCEL